ncbi:MAG: hypothetical protein ACM3XR_12420 [Bacillota bacterium]
MERIMRLPLLLSFLAAVITGAASHAAGVGNQRTYLRMAVMMLVFYLLGAFIRNTVLSLKKEVQFRMKEQKKQEEQNQKDHKEEIKAHEYAAKPHQGNDAESLEAAQLIDLFNAKRHAAPADSDDFEPLALSKAIRTKVKE